MFESSGRGRRPIVDFCLDCYYEGLSREPNEQGQVAGEKEYGSYCKRHAYERNKRSRDKRPKQIAQKAYIHGRWWAVPERDRERIGNIVLARQEELRTSKTLFARHKLFEYLCVEMAVGFGRRITLAEEDELIRVCGGSRTGVHPITILYQGKAVGSREPEQATMQPLLPHPEVRAAFRAQELGGPTTEGEPSFTEYYRQHFGKEPPEHLREDVKPDTPGPKLPQDTYVTASDGKEVRADALEDYEKYLHDQEIKRQMREAGVQPLLSVVDDDKEDT